jgi:hypothetical protein
MWCYSNGGFAQRGMGTEHKRHKKDTKSTKNVFMNRIFVSFVLLPAFVGKANREAEMKSLLGTAGLLVIFAVTSPSLLAQWPAYSTAGAPRLPNGKPDLSAPVPRTVDGKPDLSGIWNFRGGGGQPGSTVVPPGPLASTFRNIGAGLKDGLPFTPWAADLKKRRDADNAKDNPDAHCLPLGLTQLHMHPQPRKIIQTPEVVVILYEAQGGVRQIFTDGRPLPKNDPQPWWYGYSAGKWEGDTLVVETTGFRDDVWLDVNGSPLTESGKMTERFHRVNYGNLEIEVTIEDPKAYTKPFTVKMYQSIMPDTELIEFVCAENEKSSKYYDK